MIDYTDQWALVTGASSGLGALIAVGLAERGMNVVLHGRDEARLARTAAEVAAARPGARTRTVAADLGAPDGPARLLDAVADTPVEVLVNNAGFGTYGELCDLDPAREAALVGVNVAAAVALTGALAPAMRERGHGGVLAVASTAAFQPTPGQASYGASKAFLLSFSQALHAELAGTGVHVSAVCPGPTATGFVANLGDQSVRSSRMYASLAEPGPVVDAALRGLDANRGVVIPRRADAIGARAVALLPRALVTRVSRRLLAAGTHS